MSKKTILSLGLLATVLLAPHAGAEEATELKVSGLSISVKLLKGNKDISLEVFEKGKLIQKFEGLGVSLFPIDVNGKKLGLVAKDLDNDGDEELLFRTSQPPITGSLWVMRWDKKKKLLFHMTNDHGDRYLAVPQETVLRLMSNGELQFQTGVSKEILTFRWNGTTYVTR